MPDLYTKVITTTCINMLFTEPEAARWLMAMPIREDPSLGSSVAVQSGEILYSREHIKASTNDELYEALMVAATESGTTLTS